MSKEKKIYWALGAAVILALGVVAGLMALNGYSFHKQALMDQLNKEGVYNYRNEDLRFSLSLPAEFVYYQTQSKEGDGYKDIEFFVPTSDTQYPQEVQSYAKPIVVRVYKIDKWKSLAENNSRPEGFELVKEDKDRIYLIKFWDREPVDWQDKWTDEMRNKIKASCKVK